jgi:phenylalanyl-tRNA synthetase beta chain
MTISYKWICEYLPSGMPVPSPELLSVILTSVGLEVESLDKYESVKGGLQGLVIGEVKSCESHPNADKLKLTSVDTGSDKLLQIVCGAPNVAVGQKVVVAPVGATIYPVASDPVTMKMAKIRGIESQGMICAADEIGLGKDHAGILVLPAGAKAGQTAASWFRPYEDYTITIGLTPNHMDAMSHLGIAREVCAYLSHRDKKYYTVAYPSLEAIPAGKKPAPIEITIENNQDCRRYSGITIEGVEVKESPAWLQDRLRSIGLKPISNIVDITNFVLHEMGQPLHAFDASRIKGRKIIVKNLPAGTPFLTLDHKEIRLQADDLMICNEEEGMCLAGVYGGWETGVSTTTRDVFLESAWFNPEAIRKTSFRHSLRTEAALHFEKGMDISNTVSALQRAAMLIREMAGGMVSSGVTDLYPHPKPRTQVSLSRSYLKKLSGKEYPETETDRILESLGFEIIESAGQRLQVAVPYHKPDISLPADIVEEVMRIDGYDNVPIPGSILVSPAVDAGRTIAVYREKIADFLVSQGFYEIFTNSITNSAYYGARELDSAVRMINNLSTELDIMRPSMLETGLESIAYNLNRRMDDLRFFEMGKTYSTKAAGVYEERNHLAIYLTGRASADTWKGKGAPMDLFFCKGICSAIFERLNLYGIEFSEAAEDKIQYGLIANLNGRRIGLLGKVHPSVLQRFDIRQPVFLADLEWDLLMEYGGKHREFTELPKQLAVQRDLALVISRSVSYGQVRSTVEKIGLDKLRKIGLFDIFESEKLGADKKSFAVSFSFLDETRTLTDKEIDAMMARIMKHLEQDLGAEIRK